MGSIIAFAIKQGGGGPPAPLEPQSKLASNEHYRSIERRLDLLRDRIALLQRIDIVGPNQSRLLGFLKFRLHCILIEKISAISRFQTDGNLKQHHEALEPLGKELSDSLLKAWTILQHDASCPPKLKELIALMFHSK